jgi:hypothetical protein
MSRAREFGEQVRLQEEERRKERDYQLYKAQLVQSCAFQLFNNIAGAVETARGEFNIPLGRESKRAISYFGRGETAYGIRLVREHYPAVYLTAQIDIAGQCIKVQCVKTDRSGRQEDPEAVFPLEVEDNWVRIRDGGHLITESDFADLLIERFV